MSSETTEERDEREFPTADGMAVAEEGKRPGEPLHPGKHTIVNRGNHPLSKGEVVQVWFKKWADGYGTETVTGELKVIGDDGEGDIFALPAHQEPLEARRLYRIDGDLDCIQAGYIIPTPSYDSDEGELTVTREVAVRGNARMNILEARTLGSGQSWRMSNPGL